MPRRLLFLAACLLGACGSADTQLDDECGPNGECAPGFECRAVDRRCVLAHGGGQPDAGAPEPQGCATPTGGPTVHSADVRADEVWTANGSPHIVTASLRVFGTATLTIEPCAEVLMARDATIAAGASGASKLSALGTEARPIAFRQRTAGERFDGLEATWPGTLELAHVTVEGGGANRFRRGATISGLGDGQAPTKPVLKLDHVTVEDSAGMGVLLERLGTFAPGSTALTVTGSAEAVRLDAAASGDVPDGAYTGNTADAVTIYGGAVDKPIALRSLGVPYRLDTATSLVVRDGGALDVAPGVEILFGENSGLEVRGGQLVTRGTADLPVRFGPRDDKRWLQLAVTAPGKASLTHTVVEGAGSDRFVLNASIVARGDGTAPLDPVLRVDHVKVSGSGGIGILVERFASFDAGSHDLAITGSAAHALRIATPAVNSVPAGSYTGNAVDRIEILVQQNIVDTETFPDRGVPYFLSGTLAVRPPAADRMARLTVEPGVTLMFPPGSGLVIGTGSSSSPAWPGELTAVGTAEKPIVFTSAAPQPGAGDWQGLYFYGFRPTGNRIAHARIEYAGASCLCILGGCTTEESAIMFVNYPLAEKVVSSTVFANIAGNGIFASFRSDDPAAVDMTADNEFDGVSGCAQTMLLSSAGTCSRECL